jgi:hypothetical protein
MDRLDQTFRCSRFGLLAHRHCLRRQLEQAASRLSGRLAGLHPATEGPESTPGAEEPMAEAADSTERRVCSVCHETPLRSHNRSGICTQCKRNARTTARPAPAARVVRTAEDGVWPPIADAPDEYLVEAAQELANRITRIRAEAETRLEKLNGALEVLKRARED